MVKQIRGALDSIFNLQIKDKTSVGLGSTHLEGENCKVFFLCISLTCLCACVCVCAYIEACMWQSGQPAGAGSLLHYVGPGIKLGSSGSVSALPTEPSWRPSRLFPALIIRFGAIGQLWTFSCTAFVEVEFEDFLWKIIGFCLFCFEK